MNKNLILGSLCVGVLVIILLFSFFLNHGLNSTYLIIDCDGTNISGVYSNGDSFNCSLLGNKFEITVVKIERNKILLKSNNYGLSKVGENGGISLRSEENEFQLERNKQLKLGLQATDVSSRITIDWN